MRGKDHLYYLVHSLSKSEKRYFTMDARKSGRKESRYLELFHFINSQSSYDEAALKKKFGKRLADDKTRLYEALLSSLRDYQSSKSLKTRIKELLTDAKILFERKLYEQCENRLSEAKTLALELQDHLAVLEINLRQRQLIKEYQHKDYAEQVEELIAEKTRHLEIVQEEFWLHDNYDRLSVDVVRFHNRLSEEATGALTEKYEALLSFEKNPAHFYALRRYHQALAFFHRLTGNRKEEFRELEITARLWDDHPSIRAEEYFAYLADAFNLLSLSLRVPERFKQLPELIAELEQEQAKNLSAQAQALLFQGVTNYRLVYLINAKEIDVDGHLRRIEKGLSEYQITPTTELSILINCTILLFLNDQFAACLLWLEKIWHLHRKTRILRKDIQDTSRILQLLAAYKVSPIDQVENLIRSGKRYFEAQTSTGNAQKTLYLLIAKAIAKSYATASSKETKQILDDLLVAIPSLQGKLPGGIGEIVQLWTESLILQKPIQALRA